MAAINGLKKLAEFTPEGGYFSSMPKEGDSVSYMARGSENAMLSGTGKAQAFKGVTQRVGVQGGTVMTNIAETYASIGQVSDGTAYGNVMNVFAALFYIGKGLVRLAGASLLVNASATLSLLIKRSGSYTSAAECGPWQAGLAQPSAPIITPVTPPGGMIGKITGTISVVIWRIRSTTGAVSVQSPVSNVIQCDEESCDVEFPLTDSNGQDAWGIGVTKQIEGKVGAHFEILEIMETDLPHLYLDDIVTNASTTITSVTGGFTTDMIGWTVELFGPDDDLDGLPDWTHVSYVTARPDANTLTLNDAVAEPGTVTGVSLELTDRHYVFEYRDGDLVGKPYAPKRDFPPPEGLFAGTLEDVLFVDGCYADAELNTSNSDRGTALAPSEPGRPESFSPDTVIFSNDTPTGLLRGEGMYYRFGRNTTYSVQYLGGDKPISMEPIWEGIGLLYQHQACTGLGGRLYLWHTSRGLIRMGEDGLPEGMWALPVVEDLINCTDASKRVLGYDGINQVVAVCYNQTIWPYFENLNKWGAPADLSGYAIGNIKSAITENGQLLLTDDADDIWEYNVGTGSLLRWRTPWVASAGAMDTVGNVTVSVRADNTDTPVTIEVFADGDEVTVESSHSLDVPRVGYQRMPTVWPNVIDCEQHALELTIESTTATGDCGFEKAEVFGPSHDGFR